MTPSLLTPECAREWIRPWLDPVLDRYEVGVHPLKDGFQASIGLDRWDIKITLDPKFELQVEELGLEEADEPRSAHNPAADLCATLYLHEVGHWLHAPFESAGHELILSGVAKGLRAESQEVTSKKVSLVSNMFSDVIVNTARATIDSDSRVREVFRRGWRAAMRHILHDRERLLLCDAVFLAVQYRLIRPDDAELDRIVGRCLELPEVRSAVEELVEMFSPSGLFAIPRDCWEVRAERFARIISWMLPTSMDGVLLCGGNVFSERFSADESYRKEIIRHALARGQTPDAISYIPRQEVLAVLYDDRASTIVLQACNEGATTQFPVAWTGVEPIRAGQRVRPDSIKWTASRWNPHGGWRFFQRAHPLSVKRPGTAVPAQIPDLLFLLDSSESMTWTQGAGLGRYDLALTALAGIRKYLEATGIGYYLRYAAINFSNATYGDGWCRYPEFPRILDVLLRYQGGRTSLDPAVVRGLAETAEGPCWAIVISDGEIANRESAADELGQLVARGHQLSLIQIGAPTAFSTELARRGGEVHEVRSDQDLVGLVLGQAKRVWRAV